MTIEVGKQEIEEEIGRDFPKGIDCHHKLAPCGLHFGGRSVVNLDINDLIFRKITLRPAFAEPAINFPLSNRLLQEGLIDASKLITHTFGFEDARSVLQSVIDGSQPIVKAVMLLHG
jgi:threonine dehydrogenase-like Zn-dependent dehydrogenase